MTDPKQDFKKRLTSEMNEEEWKAFRADWISSWAVSLQQECGMNEKDAADSAEMDWEKYCGQEGWTGRDERMAMEREKVHHES